MTRPAWIREVPALRARLVPGDWAWAEANAAAIAAHWRERVRRQPRLFNGRVLVVQGLDPAPDGAIEAGFLEVDYAALLAWLDWGEPESGVLNGFAMGALRAADGAYLLGLMGPDTANAGQVYFPCGTPDPSDLRPDGTVDLAASLARELEEETGLRPDAYWAAAGWVVVREGGLLAFIRPLHLTRPAEAARAAILAHLAADPEPELADVVVVRGVDDIDPACMRGFVQIFLRHALGAEPEGAAEATPDQG